MTVGAVPFLLFFIMATDEYFNGYEMHKIENDSYFDNGISGNWSGTPGHDRDDAIAAMNDINAKIIGINSNGTGVTVDCSDPDDIKEKNDPECDFTAVAAGTKSQKTGCSAITAINGFVLLPVPNTVSTVTASPLSMSDIPTAPVHRPISRL